MGVGPRRAVRRERPGVVAALLRHLRGDSLGGDRARHLPRRRNPPVHRRRAPRLPADPARAGPCGDLAPRPATGTRERRRLSARPGRVRHGDRRHLRLRSGAWVPVEDPVRLDRLHLRRAWRRAGPVRRHRRATAVRGDLRPGAAHGAGPNRRVRHAPGSGADDSRRPTDVRHRRRGHSRDPPDGHHASVRLVRRLEPGDQLRVARAPGAGIGAVSPALAGSARSGPMMDRQVRRLGIALLALFLIIFAQVNYIQVFASSRLKNNAANPRIILAEYRNQRGAILARDERTVLARSVATKDDLKYLRVYPHGSLYGQITGYYSYTYGRSGLEASQNDWLAGTATQLVPETFVDELLGRPKRGATVVTTIDAKLQQTAARS